MVKRVAVLLLSTLLLTSLTGAAAFQDDRKTNSPTKKRKNGNAKGTY